MTNSQTSDSEDARSGAFTRLHPIMQRWIYDQGWTSLRDAQERAIGPILDAADVIILAPTAAGKTEAVILPVLTALLDDETSTTPRHDTIPQHDPWTSHDPWAEPEAATSTGVQALVISPLRALINDQYRRLEELCERADVALHPWHGDISASTKKRLILRPSGVLLITPESLEALFVNHGSLIPRLFAGLRYIVVDELHSFAGTPRGAQLQSQMNRIDLAIRRRAPRVALSATIGDPSRAAEFLRPTEPARVCLIESDPENHLKLQLRGYGPTRRADPTRQLRRSSTGRRRDDGAADGEAIAADGESSIASPSKIRIADHLFRHLRGKDNLVFANSREQVEEYADLLADRCNRERVANEFWAHHGSLSRPLRENVEAQLKDPTKPTTAVCTSTLELGIDIGTVSEIAQIGPPPSVASLRQRLGRSGRSEDEPSVLRLYISESDPEESVVNELRCSIVQTIAMVRLLLDKWLEAPEDPGYNYSTLVQQTMSMIAQHGGVTATQLHSALCGPGPFRLVDKKRFAQLLRAMAGHDLLTRSGDGLLLLGVAGERQLNHYRFFAAFRTATEWRLTHKGKTLGTIPITQPLRRNQFLIFAGRRWRVIEIDEIKLIIELEPAGDGRAPNWLGGFARVTDEVRAEMAVVYESEDAPAWLDRNARELLAEGRAAFRRHGLGDSHIVDTGSGVVLIPWMGDNAIFTARIALSTQGIDGVIEGPAIRIGGREIGDVMAAIRRLLSGARPRADELAKHVKNPQAEKWDWVLDKTLTCESTASRLFDIDGAWQLFESVAAGRRSPNQTMRT